jgi:hypothetical protein
MGEPKTQPNTVSKNRYLSIITNGKMWYWGGHRYVVAVKDPDVIRQVKNIVDKHVLVKVWIWGDGMPLVLNARPTFKRDKTKEYLIFHLPKTLSPTWYELYLKGMLRVEIFVPVKSNDNNKVM